MIANLFLGALVLALAIPYGMGKLAQLSNRAHHSERDSAPEPVAHLHTEAERTAALRALSPDEVRWEEEFITLRRSLDELVDHTVNDRLGHLEEWCERWVNKPAPWTVRWDAETASHQVLVSY